MYDDTKALSFTLCLIYRIRNLQRWCGQQIKEVIGFRIYQNVRRLFRNKLLPFLGLLTNNSKGIQLGNAE